MPISPERREELLRERLKPDEPNPMVQWDALVASVMDEQHISKDCAVDRCLATRTGSDLWQRAQQWEARIPKVVVQRDAYGRPIEIRTGNWSHVAGSGIARRIPRAP